VGMTKPAALPSLPPLPTPSTGLSPPPPHSADLTAHCDDRLRTLPRPYTQHRRWANGRILPSQPTRLTSRASSHRYRSIFLCAVTLFFMGANFHLDERLCGGSLAGGIDGRRRAQAGTSYMYDAAAGVGAGTGAGARLGSYKYGSDPVQAEGRGAGAAAALDVEENPICALTGWLSLVGMFIYLVSFGLGMSPIPWALNAELYPLGVRSICVGIATAANWITNFVVAATFLSLLEVLGPAITFWVYGSFAAAGFVWLSFTMPETAGKSLEEIEEIFR